MAKQPWEIPDLPATGDARNDVTFRAIGAALSNWEWFEGNLSLTFSFLIGSGYGNLAATRAYGTVESFRGRANMIREAAGVYFKYPHNKNDELEAELTDVLRVAGNFSARRNEIAHGIVQPWHENVAGTSHFKGYALFPAYYATRKRGLPSAPQLTAVISNYIYSSAEIDSFGKHFAHLADRTLNILTHLARDA